MAFEKAWIPYFFPSKIESSAFVKQLVLHKIINNIKKLSVLSDV